MPRPAPARRPVALLLGAALAAVGCSALAAPEALSADPSRVRAVVSYDGGAVDVHGVRVLRALPGLGMAAVEATPASLVRLSRTRGVRGVAPDDQVQLTGGPSQEAAVPAAQGLGGQAGKQRAGRGVRVAVLDTGVTDSAALDRRSGRLVDAFDADGGRPPYDDGFGHGTFMASVVAGGPAPGSEGKAVGVAPAATVLVVRVARPDGTTSMSKVLAGLDWVARNAGGVDVANLSFSHQRPGTAYGADPLTDAVDRVRAAGVTVVVSAGNEPGLVGDPGFTPRAVTVGAASLTGTPQVADWSGSGLVAGVAKPDLVANGVSVLGVLPPGSLVARSNPQARVGGALWRGTGSSQATAVTSGVVALLLQRRPDATPAEVKALLRASARPLPGAPDGAGLLRVPHGKADTADEPGLGGRGPDPTGEGSFDASSWSASSWSASSWSASSWSASSWSASSWSASSWSASSWSASSWSGRAP